MKSLLQKLNLRDVNPGSCVGSDAWFDTSSDGSEVVLLHSYNPTTGEPIASVIQATPAVYDRVVDASQQAFASWRSMPAPKRGLLIRDLADLLREYVEPLIASQG